MGLFVCVCPHYILVKRLLSASHFKHVFTPLQGKRVGFVKMYGNVGDRLIDWATEQLFDEFGIVYGTLNWSEGGSDIDQVLWNTDSVVIAGGGNLGSKYDNCRQLRRRYVDSGLPITVLPQSLTDTDEQLSDYFSIYMREPESIELYPQGIIAPDLTLGFTPPELHVQPDIDKGIFIREDEENHVGYPESSLGDPAQICDSVMEYLSLAARCKIIYTDRVHFAICGLIAEREVHLLPGNYHKNRSLFDSWLKDLGCKWCENVEGLPDISPNCVDRNYTSLAVPKSREIPWHMTPTLVDDVELTNSGNEIILRSIKNCLEVNLSVATEKYIEAIDGRRSIQQVCEAVKEQNSQSMLEIARDAQFLLTTLRDNGIVRFACDTTSLYPDDGSIVSEYFELHVEAPFVVGDRIRYQATFRETGQEPKVVWFEILGTDPAVFSPRGDAFVLVCLLQSMQRGLPLHVSGCKVSAGLLKNLYEFQMIFSAWYPELSCIEIYAETDETDKTEPQTTNAIAAFSGGVDSMFSIFRQLNENIPHWDYGVTTALFVRGFDIYISSPKSFNQARVRAESGLKDTTCNLISVNTNVRELYSEWRRAHGLCISAALSLFNHRYATGILASTIPYKMLYPFGSNAITDRLLGSDHFKIVHDGAEFDRFEKLQYLSGFQKALPHLRFCYLDRTPHENCGKCQKCVITAILMIALALPLDCFSNPPDSDQISKVLDDMSKSIQLNYLEYHDLHAARNELKKTRVFPEWFAELDKLIEGAQ